MRRLYSSPLAYLNRFFKGSRAFKMRVGIDVEYQSTDWLLTHIEGETFVLSRRILDHDTGADYFDDAFESDLIRCVEYIRRASRHESLSL